MKKYLAQFLVFISLVAVIMVAASQQCTPEEKQIRWGLYAYFCLLTILFHLGIVRSTKSRPQVFVRYYMAGTTIKLLFHMGIIVVYSLFHRNMAIQFILTFMTLYFLFTVFEVMAVFRQVKK